ncbi:MAG: hypothetical protein Ta2G_16280 [Termitinemataceae bacterium]|nr:MAG: hypothetical protein Ta2G_16280 [Termitinemataceae bacterium]
MKYNTSKEKFGWGVLCLLLLGFALFGCRPHSGVIGEDPDDEGGGGGQQSEAAPVLQALEFLGDAYSLTVEPAFNEGVFMYTADLAGTALDDLTINGSTNQENFLSYLAMGQTIVHPKQGDIFALKVDNSSKTKSSMYIVQLINSRIDPLPQAKLAGLSLSVGGAIAGFNEDIHSYSVNLPYGTKKVVVTPQLLSGSDYYVSYNSLTGSIIDLSKQDSVTVSVISQTTSTGSYNISFTIGASLPSELTGISVSGGALLNASGAVVGKDGVTFDPSSEAYTIKIPRGTYDSVAVSGIADNQDHVTYKQGTNTSNVISGGINHLDGKKIEIIVNAENDPARRQGSSPKIYELTVSEVDKTPASLSNITVTGAAYTLFQWSDGQVSNIEGFADGCSTYTLSISRSASNITVTGASDADTTVSYGGYASNTIANPDPAEGPLTIFASGDEFHTTTAYTVFFAYSDAYDALLSSISIHGGDLEAPSPATVNDPAQTGSSVPAKGNYIAKIPEGTTVFAVDTTAPAEYHVSCDPAFLSFPTAGQKITVTVDGGPAFNTTTYIVTVNIVPPKVPRLTSLYVGASSEQEVSFRTNVFSYRVALDPQSSSVDVPFLWAANGDTSLIHYSFNEGATWIADNNKTGFDAGDGSANSISLKSNESASVQIRLSATDGVKRIYYIDVTCRGGASDKDLLSLTVKGNAISVPANAATAMEPTFEDIGSPFGTFDITATIPTTATVAYSGGVTGLGRTVSTALAPLEEKLITITVTAENGDTKAYTLKLVMTDAVSLLSFTAKFNSYTAPPPTRLGDTYTITVPTFTDYVEVSSVVGIGVSGTTPTVEIGASAWAGQTIGDTKSITITVIPEDEDETLKKEYTVTFVKADKKMAMGGTVGYVKTGSNGEATFDEVHSFTTAGAGQNLTFSSAVDIPNARALIVGGGGGGGRSGSGASSGGGGGGGFIDQTVALSGTTFPIVVGAGGAGGANANGSRGLNGGDSSAAGLTAYGGGGGGYHWNNAVGSAKDGASGGGAGGTVNGKAIYDNQGNDGAGVTGTAPSAAGGGGGAGGAGTQANGNNKGGVGGLGRQSDILGSNGTWYAGGGSAGAQSVSYVVGTLPNGATAWNTVTPTANTGAGASGMVNSAALTDAIVGKTGASGIVIVRFPWAEQ